MTTLYTDPSKRHEFVYLFDVVNGNPNGDPDAGNLPRLDPETMHGLVTDVCLKRKIRDYVALVHNQPIFIQSQTALNRLIVEGYKKADIQLTQIPLEDEEIISWLTRTELDGFTLDLQDEKYALIYDGSMGTSPKDIQNVFLESLNDEDKALSDKLKKLAGQLAKSARKPTREERQKVQEKMLSKFYDIRLFGAVLSTGLNAGQVRGPVQLTFARSLSPIVALDLSITRVAITREADRAKGKETEMGRKPLVPYGLYRAHGFFNPHLAEKTGVTADDLALLWEALQNLFEFDRSAARGEMACRGLYIFTHDNNLGKAPAHKLFDLIRISELNSVPRKFADYRVEAPDPGDLKVFGFSGVTLTVL
ncbi:MAG: type I-C CRISPR-associated protein Cas7/Csd2 [Desulfobaccales bacterium]